MKALRILYQDDYFCCVDKPAGFQVHASPHLSEQTNAMKIVRGQTGKWIFPVHRLDRATSGVLLFAFSKESARSLQNLFQTNTIQKTYVALVRGWPAEDRFNVVTETPKNERTEFEVFRRFELPYKTRSAFETSRFALVRAKPLTGRTHQIRRHLRSLAHPIIGDTVYGDGKQNRLFRELTGDRVLFLKAYRLKFQHPFTAETMIFRSKWNAAWQRGFDVLGSCPVLGS